MGTTASQCDNSRFLFHSGLDETVFDSIIFTPPSQTEALIVESWTAQRVFPLILERLCIHSADTHEIAVSHGRN